MTDMRATERLLEVIWERADVLSSDESDWRVDGELALREIREAITELRRRGDTLVRADDLALALDVARHGPAVLDDGTQTFALDRLENALGGKMR